MRTSRILRARNLIAHTATIQRLVTSELTATALDSDGETAGSVYVADGSGGGSWQTGATGLDSTGEPAGNVYKSDGGGGCRAVHRTSGERHLRPVTI